MLARLRVPAAAFVSRSRHMSSESARPMTRFIQYPFDKTKMEEVSAWVASSGITTKMRSQPGVKDVEMSFCPGEGWLAARYIFDDLDDMVTYLGNPVLEELKSTVTGAPHYDASRQPHEFKGFYLSKM